MYVRDFNIQVFGKGVEIVNISQSIDLASNHTDTVYSVTVVTDPPSGQHTIESTVNLTCLVHPQLPGEGVTYRWRSYVQSPVAANSSLPHATLYIGRGHPHTARYHCQLYYRGQLLTSGSTVITVKGERDLSQLSRFSVHMIQPHLYCV